MTNLLIRMGRLLSLSNRCFRTNGDPPSNIYIKNCLADNLLFVRVTVIGVNDGGGVISFKKHR